MNKLFSFLVLSLVVCAAPANLFAQKAKPAAKVKETKARTVVKENKTRTVIPGKYQPPVFENSSELQSLVNKAAVDTINNFAAKGFKSDNLAVTLIDLRDAKNLKIAQFNGEVKIYPASVVKMFYLAAIHRWLADGKLQDTAELRRGMKDMIVDSSNDATHYMVDALTGTSAGTELAPKELADFAHRRHAVNRYFETLGYRNINVCQKTYCEDLYGRERQFWNAGKNRNMLTTNAIARLLTEIVAGTAVDADHSRQMLDLMKRDPAGAAKDPDDQAHGFTGIALKNVSGARLWSKAGWTSTTRHDAAYVETPDGLKFVLVVFTTNFANERGIIPGIAEIVMKNLGAIK
jgi:hypothetical protein